MKTVFSLITALFVSTTILLSAETSIHKAPFLSKTVVTVSDYCDFLNHIAVTDTHHLWDEKMATDLFGATIIRLGEPGNYTYHVLAGCEKNAVSWLSWFDKTRYCNWQYNRSQTLEPRQNNETEKGVYILSENEDLFAESILTNIISALPFIVEDEVASDLDPSFARNGDTFTIAAAVVGTLAFLRDDATSSYWTTEDTVGLVLLLAAAAWGFSEPLSKVEKPYDTDEFRESDRTYRRSYVDTQRPIPWSNTDSSTEASRAQDSEEVLAKRKQQLEGIDQILAIKSLRETSDLTEDIHNQEDEGFFGKLQGEPKKVREQLQAISWDGKQAFSQAIQHKIRSFKESWSHASDSNDDSFSRIINKIENSLSLSNEFRILEPLKKILEGESRVFGAQNIAPRSLSADEEGLLTWTLETARLRLYQIQKYYEYQQAVKANPNKKGQLINDLNVSFERAADKITERETRLNEMNRKQEHIQKRLAFLKDGNEKENIDRQLWTILSAQDNEQKIITIRCLETILENHVRRLECTQRIEEIELQETPDQTLIDSYQKLKQDLTANPHLGITRLDYLRYAWEHQGALFYSSDPYYVAPKLTRILGLAIQVPLLIPSSHLLYYGAWLAVVAQLAGV